MTKPKLRMPSAKKLLALCLSLNLLFGLVACTPPPDQKLEPQTKASRSDQLSASAEDGEEEGSSPSDSPADQAVETTGPDLEVETEPEQIEAQVGNKDSATGFDLSQDYQSELLAGNEQAADQELYSLSDFQLADQFRSRSYLQARFAYQDQAYQAELAALAAQAAQIAANPVPVPAPPVQVPAQNQAPPVGVTSMGAAGLHDTYAGAATIINLLNQHRANLGLVQLANDAVMREIALVRAPQVGVSYRASGDATGHYHGGVFALTWIASVYGARSGLAENTGFFTSGTKTPEQIYTAFINSPPHYTTMVNPNLTRVGIALYYDPVDNREYVVMNFGN